MKIVCAWCKEEGRGVVLGEREPLEDTTETHTICARHRAKLLEELPSPSFPGIRLLLVLHPTENSLHRYLNRALAGLPYVKVIRDRRQREQSETLSDASNGRRRANRRLRRAEFSSLGYLIVRFGTTHEAVVALGRDSSVP